MRLLIKVLMLFTCLYVFITKTYAVITNIIIVVPLKSKIVL